MVRMLIHAGFHKTGTTSVQKTLAHNQRLVSRHIRVFLRKDMIAVCEAARAYSASRNPLDLITFSYEFASFLEDLDPNDERNICISSEDLCGHMPGRRGLQTYDAAPYLMKAIVHTMERALPETPETLFYFSTRDASGWLRSCYAQHLGAVRMKLSLPEYMHDYQDSANLAKIVAMARIAVEPHKVVTHALEEFSQTRLGPLQPISRYLEMPRRLQRNLELLPPANVSLPQSILSEYLRINQSDLDYNDVRKAKNQAMQRWQDTLTKTQDAPPAQRS